MIDKLLNSDDIHADFAEIFPSEFYSDLSKLFCRKPDPYKLFTSTQNTVQAYLRGWREKNVNKSTFLQHTGKHFLLTGMAADQLAYSLRQLAKSEFTEEWLLRGIKKHIDPSQKRGHAALAYTADHCGPNHPFQFLREIAEAIAKAVDDQISLPDKKEVEAEYLGRAEEFNEYVRNLRAEKRRTLPAHHALEQAAIAFRPIWEKNSNLLYYKGRYDESLDGYVSKPAEALHFVIRKIDPEIKVTLVGTAIGKTRSQS